MKHPQTHTHINTHIKYIVVVTYVLRFIRIVDFFFDKKSDCVNSSALYLLEEEWKKIASQKQEEEELTTSQREMIDYIWFLGDGYLERKGSFYIWYIEMFLSFF